VIEVGLSPDFMDIVIIYFAVLADQGKGMIQALGDEDAIERISMMQWQGKINLEVVETDW
jgi:hypothetical protein